METAIEIKSSKRIDNTHAKGLRALSESHNLKQKMLASFEEENKNLYGDIKCLYWKSFLEQL